MAVDHYELFQLRLSSHLRSFDPDKEFCEVKIFDIGNACFAHFGFNSKVVVLPADYTYTFVDRNGSNLTESKTTTLLRCGGVLALAVAMRQAGAFSTADHSMPAHACYSLQQQPSGCTVIPA